MAINTEATNNCLFKWRRTPDIAADPVVQYMSIDGLEKTIEKTKKQMKAAAKELDFIEAARLRDEMFALQKFLQDKIQNNL